MNRKFNKIKVELTPKEAYIIWASLANCKKSTGVLLDKIYHLISREQRDKFRYIDNPFNFRE